MLIARTLEFKKTEHKARLQLLRETKHRSASAPYQVTKANAVRGDTTGDLIPAMTRRYHNPNPGCSLGQSRQRLGGIGDDDSELLSRVLVCERE